MLVFRKIPAQATSPTVLTIGNFDGLHLGHRAMLARLATKACDMSLPAAVMTFEPHPRELFTPEQAPARLTSFREKLALLEACSVDRTYVCRFDRKLAALTAEEFIDVILVRGLSVRHVIIGDDFRFGKGRGGDFALLERAGLKRGFTCEAMHTVEVDGERVSSSAVRDALAEGDLEHAARLLGRPYVIAGSVVHGNKLGRKLGYPTANIQLKGVASLGVRPTLGQGLKPVLEVHLFDFDREVYGAHVAVHFLHKLRDEAKFESLEALTAQIARDVAAAKSYFSEGSHG